MDQHNVDGYGGTGHHGVELPVTVLDREVAQLGMVNLGTALAAAGDSLTDVISTRVLMATTSQADLVTAWEAVWDAFGATMRRAR